MIALWKVRLQGLGRFDEVLSAAALLLMTLIPLIEIVLRPMLGRGIENASVLVQHLGLVLAMFGAVAAERHGHLSSMGSSLGSLGTQRFKTGVQLFSKGSAALICGLLAMASWRFVDSEIGVSHSLAYGWPVWWVQATMPLGFLLLGAKLGLRCADSVGLKVMFALGLPTVGFMWANALDGSALLLWRCRSATAVWMRYDASCGSVDAV